MAAMLSPIKPALSTAGFIYVVQMEGHPLYKIGRSVDVPRRMSEFGILLPFPYRLVFSFRVSDTRLAEAAWHRTYQHCRLNGEWFCLSPDDIAFIRSHVLLDQAVITMEKVAARLRAEHKQHSEESQRLLLSLVRRYLRRSKPPLTIPLATEFVS